MCNSAYIGSNIKKKESGLNLLWTKLGGRLTIHIKFCYCLHTFVSIVDYKYRLNSVYSRSGNTSSRQRRLNQKEPNIKEQQCKSTNGKKVTWCKTVKQNNCNAIRNSTGLCKYEIKVVKIHTNETLTKIIIKK